jgi:hypothetical protein
MQRTFIAVCGAVVLSAALAGAQEKPAANKDSNTGSNSNSAAPTVTFTGCLNAGSAQNSYFLTSAKHKGPKTTDKSVKIVPGPKVGLDRYVTQEVEVTGTIDPAEPPAEAKADDAQQVRTLTVTKVKYRAQNCG